MSVKAKIKRSFATSFISIMWCIAMLGSGEVYAQRVMENLGRGLVAIKAGSGYFLSWRFLGTEYVSDNQYGFNVYKGSTKLNSAPITNSTNYQDNSDGTGVYTVRAVIDGKEQAPSTPARVISGNYLSIPLKATSNYYTHFIWPGDLDGDGEYELVAARRHTSNAGPNLVDAYKLDGTFLWRVDMGPNSYTQLDGANAPPASILGWEVGGFRCRDGLAVYDLDLDGKAEVMVQSAAGVTFADGKKISGAASQQYLSVIEGTTGKEICRTPYPEDAVSTKNPLAGQFGIGWLDGKHPSLIGKMINRTNRVFATAVYAWDFDGKTAKLRWSYIKKEAGEEFHQIRILDVNGDGKDDLCDGGWVLNSDGKWLYSIPKVIHGDRFHITDMDPDRPGLEGFGIQQTEGSGVAPFAAFYYEAATGKMIRTYGPSGSDPGRGTIGDIDAGSKGVEMWYSGSGTIDVAGKTVSTKAAGVNFKIWWDGDLLTELLDCTTIAKGSGGTLLNAGGQGAVCNTRNAPPFYGDILGDWREEGVWESSDRSKIMIFTTTEPTSHRLYTLPHNSAYRSCMTTRGYYQSNLVDYYLGEDMKDPPKPNITVVGDPLVYVKKEGSIKTESGIMYNPQTFTVQTINSLVSGSVAMYQINGKRVFNRNIGASSEASFRLPVESLNKGSYLMKISNNGSSEVHLINVLN